MAAGANASGGACGYYTEVSLFGGPPGRLGCGQDAPLGTPESACPSVALPAGGSTVAVTASDATGAIAEYGPAVVFGGKPPADPNAPIPPSGAIKVSTKGKLAVTSTASVKHVGPGPFVADGVSATCHAAKAGATASATITKGVVVTAFDADGNPSTVVPVPTHPPVNHTLTGELPTKDDYKVVFNEQVTAADGTITVTAVHVYLLGPTAVGDVVIAQAWARA